MEEHHHYNVHIPDNIISVKHSTPLLGFATIMKSSVDIYIYSMGDCPNNTTDLLDKSQYCIGGFLMKSDINDSIQDDYEYFITLRILDNVPEIVYLKIKNVVDLSASRVNIVILMYTYDILLKSEGFSELSSHNKYSVLSHKIKALNTKPRLSLKHNKDWRSRYKLENLQNALAALVIVCCEHSTLCTHMKSFVEYLIWIFDDTKRMKKLTIKSGNMILALIVDFILGIILLNWLNDWCRNPSDDFMHVIEMIVNNFRHLLQWLMGSPAGLKLNHAFNNTLGKFFLYHIELWWMFIGAAVTISDLPVVVFKYVGIFGITFQSAILADFLTLASLHVYCIYVYAARLYYMQVTGLVALWRLFLGKKKNPLRGGVDSCQYTHQQLFVGMLAFTILLFLLPTTALYYIVFTLFRICIVIMSGLLTRIRYFVSSLPLYVLLLWLIDSPRIASNVQISVLQSNKPSRVILGVTFTSNPLRQLIDYYRPEVTNKPTSIEWFKLITNLWMGELIYPV